MMNNPCMLRLCEYAYKYHYQQQECNRGDRTPEGTEREERC